MRILHKSYSPSLTTRPSELLVFFVVVVGASLFWSWVQVLGVGFWRKGVCWWGFGVCGGFWGWRRGVARGCLGRGRWRGSGARPVGTVAAGAGWVLLLGWVAA